MHDDIASFVNEKLHSIFYTLDRLYSNDDGELYNHMDSYCCWMDDYVPKYWEYSLVLKDKT